ncbi:MAG: hypothetical protein ACQEXJ_07015 [Myxococcota bacterium]
MRVFAVASVVLFLLCSASACEKERPAAEPEPAAEAEVEDPEEGAGAAEPLPEPTGELDAATCKRVCDHATTLTMKSLPADAGAEMKAEIDKALRESCPRDCLEEGTQAMADCIMAARTALELASCPK